uniref:ZP domain-containing protein n=1 Tax=Clastoptera arizonana TaxID=38151 RepID=A0A1B6CA67_9HEMI
MKGLLIYFITILVNTKAAQLPTDTTTQDIADDLKIECNNNDINIEIITKSGTFNGMIYPKGLSKNSTCLTEYFHQITPINYKLPLRSCNTMNTEMSDSVEYFNTIVVQPHRKLVTNQGRGFHIRCRYQTKDKNVNDISTSATMLATSPMPGCTMKIFSDVKNNEVAENVKIGEMLTMVIEIDNQNMYGLKITDCSVRDGLGWGEQKLTDFEGCPIDKEIMGLFQYSKSQTSASVHFQAHKFPYTDSVYYQCSVQLCLKSDVECQHVQSDCKYRKPRRKREDEGTQATIEVYNGFYVNEANDFITPEQQDLISRDDAINDPDSICISQKNFAIAISVAGLILMLLVIAAFIILLTRRRTPKTISTSGSSIYSGPYTNTGYSHSN